MPDTRWYIQFQGQRSAILDILRGHEKYPNWTKDFVEGMIRADDENSESLVWGDISFTGWQELTAILQAIENRIKHICAPRIEICCSVNHNYVSTFSAIGKSHLHLTQAVFNNEIHSTAVKGALLKIDTIIKDVLSGAISDSKTLTIKQV